MKIERRGGRRKKRGGTRVEGCRRKKKRSERGEEGAGGKGCRRGRTSCVRMVQIPCVQCSFDFPFQDGTDFPFQIGFDFLFQTGTDLPFQIGFDFQFQIGIDFGRRGRDERRREKGRQ